MSRKPLKARETRKRGHSRRRLPRLGGLVVGGIVAAFAGLIVVMIVYGVMSGGGGSEGGRPDFEAAITETRSEDSGQPFQGGARLHFPVEEIDFGHVPLNTNVSYAFAMTNVGDAEVEIEDVGVKILDGC